MNKGPNVTTIIAILIYLCAVIRLVAFGEPTIEGIVKLTLATVVTIVAIRAIESS